MIKYY